MPFAISLVPIATRIDVSLAFALANKYAHSPVQYRGDGPNSARAPKRVVAGFAREVAPSLRPRMAARIVQATQTNHAACKAVLV